MGGNSALDDIKPTYPDTGVSGKLSDIIEACIPRLTLPNSDSERYARIHLGDIIDNIYTGLCGEAISPTSRMQALTVASIGAIRLLSGFLFDMVFL